MAMATDPEVTGAPDWSEGTLERRYYDALEDLQMTHLGFTEDNDHFLNNGVLVDIMLSWDRRYKDTYELYIDVYDNIEPARLSGVAPPDAKIILVRCHKDRWQACCYFGEKSSSDGTSRDGWSGNNHSAQQSSVNGKGDQTPGCMSSTTPENFDNSTNGADNTSTAVHSTLEKLANILERLVTGVEKIAFAVDALNTSGGNLRIAVDDIIASLDKIAHHQSPLSPDQIPNDDGSWTSTKYDFGLDTPSSMQDAGTAESLPDNGAFDDVVTNTAHSVGGRYAILWGVDVPLNEGSS